MQAAKQVDVTSRMFSKITTVSTSRGKQTEPKMVTFSSIQLSGIIKAIIHLHQNGARFNTLTTTVRMEPHQISDINLRIAFFFRRQNDVIRDRNDVGNRSVRQQTAAGFVRPRFRSRRIGIASPTMHLNRLSSTNESPRCDAVCCSSRRRSTPRVRQHSPSLSPTSTSACFRRRPSAFRNRLPLLPSSRCPAAGRRCRCHIRSA